MAAVVAGASSVARVIATNRLLRARFWRKPASLFPCSFLERLRGSIQPISRWVKKRGMNATKEQHIEVEGVVTVVLPGTMFRVELDNKHVVLATICGKMRKRWVRLTAGDRVKMEMSPYDLNKARITWRLR